MTICTTFSRKHCTLCKADSGERHPDCGNAVITAAAQGVVFGGNPLTGAPMGWLSHYTWDFSSTPLHAVVLKWVLFQQTTQKTPGSTAIITALIYAIEEAGQIVLI